MRDIYTTYNNYKKYEGVSSELVVEGNVYKPDITVFIPTYKRPETLRQTIESAVNQFGNINYEILIVNNEPSTTPEIITDFIKSFNSSRIYYYSNKSNIGMYGNWNRGVELSRGFYITMIHDDDLLSPYCLSSIMTAIKENNNPGIIGVDAIYFNSESMPKFLAPSKIKYRHVSKKSFFFDKYVGIAGLTVKRNLLFEMGGYDEEYYPNADSIMIYKALLNDSVINIEYPLAAYRKEINTTLLGDTMENIIVKIESTRINIAKYERFAKIWMLFFNKEYLYCYIQSANQGWGTKVDYKAIFDRCKINNYIIKKWKYCLMKFFLKIIHIRY